MRLRLFLSLICLFLVPLLPAFAVQDPAALHVNDTPAADAADLIRRSEIVAAGRIESRVQEFPTGRSVSTGKVVNYIQRFHVQKTLKGPGMRQISVLSRGIEPLPDRFSPLNMTYPGPLAEGIYLLFLQRVKGTDLYSITGFWQGVYPILNERTIALRGSGFPELHGLTLSGVERELKRIGHR